MSSFYYQFRSLQKLKYVYNMFYKRNTLRKYMFIYIEFRLYKKALNNCCRVQMLENSLLGISLIPGKSRLGIKLRMREN